MAGSRPAFTVFFEFHVLESLSIDLWYRESLERGATPMPI